MRRLAAAAGIIWSLSCGGDSPSRPDTIAPPPPPPPPANAWSLAGTLVDTAARQPIGGATIAPTWQLASVQTAADGSYQLSAADAPPDTPFKLTVSAAEVVTRELWVTWQRGPRTGITLDAIRDRPPFSMEFYRQFVRGTFDRQDGPFANFRWMESPRFYVKTVDQNGRAVEPEVMAVVREALGRAVQEFSAGKFSIAALETGTEIRPAAPGWINVDIRRDPKEDRVCGSSFIGANPGTITLNNDVCSCGSNKIPGALVLHEVGHALGFFHVADRNSVMYPFLPGNCPSGQLSAAEKFHSAIAYSRPRGNRDPDIDPVAGQFVTSPPALRVQN